MADQRNMTIGTMADLDGMPVEVGADHNAVYIRPGTGVTIMLDPQGMRAGVLQLRTLLRQAAAQAERNGNSCTGPCCLGVAR